MIECMGRQCVCVCVHVCVCACVLMRTEFKEIRMGEWVQGLCFFLLLVWMGIT